MTPSPLAEDASAIDLDTRQLAGMLQDLDGMSARLNHRQRGCLLPARPRGGEVASEVR
jgi:hypothetical protein